MSVLLIIFFSWFHSWHYFSPRWFDTMCNISFRLWTKTCIYVEWYWYGLCAICFNSVFKKKKNNCCWHKNDTHEGHNTRAPSHTHTHTHTHTLTLTLTLTRKFLSGIKLSEINDRKKLMQLGSLSFYSLFKIVTIKTAKRSTNMREAATLSQPLSVTLR